MNRTYTPIEANALYTGGGIWLFLGKCQEDGQYYMLDDYGSVLIVNEDPRSCFDDCCYPEWQQEHQTAELKGKQGYDFSVKVLKMLETYIANGTNKEECGGIFREEIEHYKQSWKKLSKYGEAHG